ncbi:hypothetical protein OH77DRAFT_1440674 [Trametes cingulata]|nr:hypothetical protein OH77DRAFT_1440674 [Trametes cingulata]
MRMVGACTTASTRPADQATVKTNAAGEQELIQGSFSIGSPLDSLKDNTAPPLPSLLTPAMAALVTAVASANPIGMKDMSDPVRTSGMMECHSKKPARQRVTTSKTARDHPTATTEEFDNAYRNLLDTVALQFNAILASHEFTSTCPTNELPEAVIESFHAIKVKEQGNYEEVAKKRSERSKTSDVLGPA